MPGRSTRRCWWRSRGPARDAHGRSPPRPTRAAHHLTQVHEGCGLPSRVTQAGVQLQGLFQPGRGGVKVPAERPPGGTPRTEHDVPRPC
jgi:hypothetical protein